MVSRSNFQNGARGLKVVSFVLGVSADKTYYEIEAICGLNCLKSVINAKVIAFIGVIK